MSARGKIGIGTLACVALFAMTGCGGHDHDPDHHDAHEGGGHVHAAPHGGALVMLGEHVAQLEFVARPEQGELSLYALDGGAEHFLRISAPAIEGVARVGEASYPLVFEAVADAASGETVGDTAYFRAGADWLEPGMEFECELLAVEIAGRRFESVVFSYPEGKH